MSATGGRMRSPCRICYRQSYSCVKSNEPQPSCGSLLPAFAALVALEPGAARRAQSTLPVGSTTDLTRPRPHRPGRRGHQPPLAPMHARVGLLNSIATNVATPRLQDARTSEEVRLILRLRLGPELDSITFASTACPVGTQGQELIDALTAASSICTASPLSLWMRRKTAWLRLRSRPAYHCACSSPNMASASSSARS